MKNSILSILLFCLLNSVTAQEFRFAWMSDTHVGGATGKEDLINSVRDINSFNDIEFVVISGDITQTGKDSDLETAKYILDELKVPYYIIPGNHDTKWSESGATKFAKLWGRDKFVFEYKGYTFIGLHQGPLMKMGDGHFAPEDLRWLDQRLKTISKSKPLIFVTHYPLDNQIDNWFEVTDRLKPYNVQFVMVGHGHGNRKLDFEGLPGVMGRSNLRAKQPVGGFNIVDVKKDSVYFTERNPEAGTTNLWHSLQLEKKNFLSQKIKFERPEYNVNKEFPDVKRKWEQYTNFTITGTPAVNDKYVITGNTSGKVICFDVENGNEIWSYQTEGPVYSSPAIYSEKVYFGSADSNIYCINLQGDLIWKYKTGAAVISSPVIKDNVLYIGGSDKVFRAINSETGKPVWENNQVKGFVETKPLLYGGKVIFGAWDTYLYALNTNDGSLAWTWTNGNKDELYSPAVCIPVAAKNKVYVVAPDRYMTALNISNGKPVWRSNEFLVREAIGITGDSTIITRCITDTLAAFEPSDTRKVKWVSDLNYGYDINPFMPVEKDGTIFVGTKNGFLYAADKETGKLKWKYRVSHSLINTVTPVSGNDVIVTNMDGEVVRINYKKN